MPKEPLFPSIVRIAQKNLPKIELPKPVDPRLKDCPNLARREFLIKGSILATAVSIFSLPLSVQRALARESEAALKGLLLTSPLVGFNGQRRDPVSGLYLLGNGYRAYNPSLMRFHSMDSMSPFGKGGLNPYVYCHNDPINNTDPSGHISFSSILNIVGGAITIGFSVALGIGSFGTLSPLSVSLSSVGGALLFSGAISLGVGAALNEAAEVSKLFGAKESITNGLSIAGTIVSAIGIVGTLPLGTGAVAASLWSKIGLIGKVRQGIGVASAYLSAAGFVNSSLYAQGILKDRGFKYAGDALSLASSVGLSVAFLPTSTRYPHSVSRPNSVSRIGSEIEMPRLNRVTRINSVSETAEAPAGGRQIARAGERQIATNTYRSNHVTEAPVGSRGYDPINGMVYRSIRAVGDGNRETQGYYAAELLRLPGTVLTGINLSDQYFI